MDALTSFVYLADHVPEWIQQVDALSTHAAEKHAEFVADYHRHLEYARPKKQRTPSLQSIHTDKDEPLEPPHTVDPTTESTPSLPHPFHISPFEAGNKYILAQAQKKRKLGSSVRSGASGPQKFRTKHMVIIYYDAHLQEQLEMLVKAIGGARNKLRKGKVSQSLTRGLQLPSFGSNDSYNFSSNYGPRRMTPTSPKLKTEPSLPLTLSKPTVQTMFADADKHLEIAQTTCETAAHQVLRDGDCSAELKEVLTRLQAGLEVAKIAVTELQGENEREKQELEAQNPSDSDATLVSEYHREPLYNPTAKLIPFPNDTIKADSRLIADNALATIEVDTDSDDDDDGIPAFNIQDFRRTNAARINGIRV